MSSSSLTSIEVRPGIRLSAGLAVFLEEPRALVVADVHWGYAHCLRAAGWLLPAWGDATIEHRLTALIACFQPRQLIIAGDVVHGAAGRIDAERVLTRLAEAMPIVLISGNHDRAWRFPTVRTHQADGFFFHHGDQPHMAPDDCVEVIGHHHPAAAWYDRAGTSLKMPALVEGSRRLVLPAFSPWAAGVTWNHRLEAGERLWLISPQRIFPIAGVALATRAVTKPPRGTRAGKVGSHT